MESEFDTDRTIEEVSDFFKHFEIDQMITHKCIAVTCFKLRDQRFCLKQLSGCISNELFLGKQYMNNDNNPVPNKKLIQPWIDMLPQLPKQHVLQCYGFTRIKDHYYSICDLVEDNKLVMF